MDIKKFIHENKLGLSVIGIILGLPLIIISTLSFMYSTEGGNNDFVQFSYDLFGEWAFWIVIPGLIMFLVGIYNIYDFYRKMKEFRELMTIDSKAKFIKNIDRIEFLAWRLHPNYEKVVIEKKKKYKIR